MKAAGLRRLLMLVGLLGLYAQAGAGQTAPSPPPPPQKEAPDAAVNLMGLIRLNVLVRDASGNAVAGLQREDFTVLDNGQPQKIVAFRSSVQMAAQPAGAAPEASVVILLDTLALPSDLATEERQQVLAFLRQDGGRLRYPVTVYTLEDAGFYLTAKASQDGNALAAAVEADGRKDPQFLPSTIKTNLMTEVVIEPEYEQDPPLTGIRALGTIAAAEDGLPGRKVLLWVGPGLRDTGTGAYPDIVYRRLADARTGLIGSYTPPDVAKLDARQDIFGKAFWFSTLLRQAGITLDVFSVGERAWGLAYVSTMRDAHAQAEITRVANAWKPFQDGPDAPAHANSMDLYKKVLAAQTGGRVFDESKEIAQQMDECVRDADTYYSLTFDPGPAKHADEYHPLEVKLRRPGLTAETSRSYFDQPFYDDPPQGWPVTVEALEEMLQKAHGGREQDQMLREVALSERPTDAEVAKLRAEVHGGNAQEALELVTDAAEFKPPSKSGVLPDAPPTDAEQQQMLERAQGYLDKTIPRLPDFFAIRQAEQFDSRPAYHELSTTLEAVPLFRADVSKANVLYRQGAELVNGHSLSDRETATSLVTYGTFGPILKTARMVLEYTQGISWGRWERGPTGREAVFQFAVPATGPNDFVVAGCCVPDRAGNPIYRVLPANHGEIAVDPESGAILRIVVVADLNGFDPVEQSELVVKYAPVTAGGRTWILPLRSVSLWRGRLLPGLREWNVTFFTWGPEETRMNLFTFDHYHVFHGSVRMLPGFEQLGKQPQ